ncbi:MAG: BON domain-containing protein, partial [Pseudomonadota bacterium]
ELGVSLHRFPVHIEFNPALAAVTLDGEVETIVAKKRAFRLAGQVEGVEWVIDRIRVHPAEQRGDGAIRASLLDALMQESSLRDCALRVRETSVTRSVRELRDAQAGGIEIMVRDGVVELYGQTLSLSHKRLVDALAWWVPGVRDVVNEIQVVPPEADNDDEIADAVRIVLEKDPLVHADQIGVRVRQHTVWLSGLAGTAQERHMAELDAWYLTGVDEVINDIAVRR